MVEVDEEALEIIGIFYLSDRNERDFARQSIAGGAVRKTTSLRLGEKRRQSQRQLFYIYLILVYRL